MIESKCIVRAYTIGDPGGAQTFSGFRTSRRRGRRRTMSVQNMRLSFPKDVEKGNANNMERDNRLTEAQVKELAKPLVAMVREFYENPKNMKGFLKWQEERKAALSDKS